MTEGDMARDRQELVEIQGWLRDLTVARLVRGGMTEADAIAAGDPSRRAF